MLGFRFAVCVLKLMTRLAGTNTSSSRDDSERHQLLTRPYDEASLSHATIKKADEVSRNADAEREFQIGLPIQLTGDRLHDFVGAVTDGQSEHSDHTLADVTEVGNRKIECTFVPSDTE